MEQFFGNADAMVSRDMLLEGRGPAGVGTQTSLDWSLHRHRVVLCVSAI